MASAFAPYMVPSSRPELHYVLDRPGAPERVLVLRGAGYAWKIEGDAERDIHVSWVAPDPPVRDPVTKTATGWAGYGSAGRTYPLTYPRHYPAGSVAPSSAVIQSHGDLAVRPLLRVFGPITTPVVDAIRVVPGSGSGGAFTVQPGYSIAAGHYVDIDNAAKTVRVDGDPGQSAISYIDWSKSGWVYVPPAPSYTQITLTGGSTNAITQVEAIWQDAYYA